MAQHFSIQSYVTLRNNRITQNGQLLFENEALSGPEFLQAAYAHFQFNYPKFFKMDNLCKTGFIAAELLLRNHPEFVNFKPEEKGIILQNANSSLDTDIKYEASIATAPSPSLFVYTLPNVLIGELCIRHQVKGETACFVFDIFDADFQAGYVNSLLANHGLKTCVSAWADYYDGKAEAFFSLVGPGTGDEHSAENLAEIWT
ncbi:MAG TPA: hypothetical protein VK154_12280 [Chitinophagales bacterium]|nr:hypothetical protein [Chitinophagales bacterium]